MELWLGEDEFWPWWSIDEATRQDLRERFMTRVVVDEATAERWHTGLDAAYALQAEIAAVVEQQESRKS